MKYITLIVVYCAALSLAHANQISDGHPKSISVHKKQTQKVASNTALSSTEVTPNLTEGFTDLFASGDFSNWTSIKGTAIGEGWSIENGIIHRSGKRPGDIITRDHYKDFELRFDWKISEAGNSGVKYRTRGKLGLEYQILDDTKNKDRKSPTHRAASLYELVAAPDDKPLKAVGEWNHSRIHIQGNQIQHWLNGVKVVELEYGSDDWKKRFQKSKYKKHEGFGSWTGPILLQDHNDEVWFQNVLIREL